MTHTTNNTDTHTQADTYTDYLHFRSGSPFLTQTYRKGTNFTFTALLVAYSFSLLFSLSTTSTLRLLIHSVSCWVVSFLLSMRVFSAYTLHFYAHFIHKLHGIFIVPQEVFPRNYPNASPCLFASVCACVCMAVCVCVCLITSLRDLSLASLQSPCGNCA